MSGVHVRGLDATVKRLTDAGFEVCSTERLRKTTTNCRKQYLRAVCNQISAYFPHADRISALCTLFDVASLPSTNDAALETYGTSALFVLKDFYCPSLAQPPPAANLIPNADEKAAAARERANFEARREKGDLINGKALETEWAVFRPLLASWRDEFAAAQEKALARDAVAQARAAGTAAKKAQRERQKEADRNKAEIENAQKAQKEKAENARIDEKKVKAKPKSKPKAKAKQNAQPKSKESKQKAPDRDKEKADEMKEKDDVKEKQQSGKDEKQQEAPEQKVEHSEAEDKRPRLTMAAVVKRLFAETGLLRAFPNLAKLAAIAVILPMSSVDCERIFSCLNRYDYARYPLTTSLPRCSVKTIARNKMQADLLNWLVLISFHTPDDLSKFNVDAAVEYWANRWNHRVVVTATPAFPAFPVTKI